MWWIMLLLPIVMTAIVAAIVYIDMWIEFRRRWK